MPVIPSESPAPLTAAPVEHNRTPRPIASTENRRPDFWVLIFFTSLFLLFGSGRLGSTDANDQLQAALIWVNTGQMGVTVPPKGFVQQRNPEGQMVPVPKQFWWQAPNGLYYQTHDIGNVALMTPIAALVSLKPGQQLTGVNIETPLLAKVLVSFLWSCIGAATCFVLYKTFALLYDARAGFGLAMLFALGTFFWPYTKTVWDVTPAAFCAALLLYQCARRLTEDRLTVPQAVGMTLTVALSATFRFGTLPFLGLALLIIAYHLRKHLRPAHFLACAAAFLAAMLPTFLYNHIRMGAFWRPATLIWRYKIAGTADFSGDFLPGFYGLTFSLNKGIFVCAPILLLILLLPWVWKKLPPVHRQMVGAFGSVAFAYVLMFAKIPSWSGAVGWGPRYMVNFLPLFFFVAAAVFMALWDRYRTPLLALAAVSVVANFPPLVVNWDMAIVGSVGATRQYSNRPYPQLALWRGLGFGLRGEPLPLPVGARNDMAAIDANRRFPDLWYAKLAAGGGKARVAGYLVPLLLVGAMAFAVTRGNFRAPRDAA